MRGLLTTIALLAGAAGPVPALADVPAVRTGGPTIVVCRPDSAARIRASWPGRGAVAARSRAARLRLLGQCRHGDVAAAVDAAGPATRVLVLPGVYRGPAIAVEGRRDIQLQGTGRFAHDVVIAGDRRAPEVIRAERADGLAIVNLTVQEGARADIEVADTNGFRLQKLVTRWSGGDGARSVRSAPGLYDTIQANGNSHAGLAVVAPPAGCGRPGIEVRASRSFGNLLGYAGRGDSGTYAHANRFAGNATGVTIESFGPAGPEACSRWEGNVVASNNLNPYLNAGCASAPFAARPRGALCPFEAVPVGSGLVFHGANRNLVRANAVYDNWRSGVRLSWAPAVDRGELDPALQFDTSQDNRFVDNRFGARPDGTRKPNGLDVWWDEEGAGNCWTRGTATSDPAPLPVCPHGSPLSTGDPVKQALEVPCAAWDARTDPSPPGCDWPTTPAAPR